MDLLSQYQQEHPEAFREQPKWQPSAEYGFFIRLVMRLSGGRVRDAQQATRILAIVAAITAIASLAVFFAGRGTSTSPPPPTPYSLGDR